MDYVLQAQLKDPYLMSMQRKVKQWRKSDFTIGGIKPQKLILSIISPANKELNLEEAYGFAYTMHLSITEVYHIMKEYY